eukprot:Hpha_TRINITY_DN22550_c0_g1::TRINITY_DN22550_c0_g1_i1::g.185029::m.185029
MASADVLWQCFTGRLRENNTGLSDICGCSAAVLGDLLADLGFSPLERARLQTEFRQRVLSASQPHLSQRLGRLPDPLPPIPVGFQVIESQAVDHPYLASRFARRCVEEGIDGGRTRQLWWRVEGRRAVGDAVQVAAKCGWEYTAADAGLLFSERALPDEAEDAQPGLRFRLLCCEVFIPPGLEHLGSLRIHDAHLAVPRAVVLLERGFDPPPPSPVTTSRIPWFSVQRSEPRLSPAPPSRHAMPSPKPSMPMPGKGAALTERLLRDTFGLVCMLSEDAKQRAWDLAEIDLPAFQFAPVVVALAGEVAALASFLRFTARIVAPPPATPPLPPQHRTPKHSPSTPPEPTPQEPQEEEKMSAAFMHCRDKLIAHVCNRTATDIVVRYQDPTDIVETSHMQESEKEEMAKRRKAMEWAEFPRGASTDWRHKVDNAMKRIDALTQEDGKGLGNWTVAPMVPDQRQRLQNPPK